MVFMAAKHFSGDQAFECGQTSTAADCPRCGSTNTKFCYYNNYNKSQPRHFCKSCKRHWTKGGALRDIPSGHRRRNKRHRPPVAAPAPPRQLNTYSLSTDMQKDMSDILYQALVRSSPPSAVACIDVGVPQCTILESQSTAYTPQNQNSTTFINYQSSGETTEGSTVTTRCAPAPAVVNPANLWNWNWNSEMDCSGDIYALWEDFDAEYKPIFGGYYPYNKDIRS